MGHLEPIPERQDRSEPFSIGNNGARYRVEWTIGHQNRLRFTLLPKNDVNLFCTHTYIHKYVHTYKYTHRHHLNSTSWFDWYMWLDPMPVLEWIYSLSSILGVRERQKDALSYHFFMAGNVNLRVEFSSFCVARPFVYNQLFCGFVCGSTNFIVSK